MDTGHLSPSTWPHRLTVLAGILVALVSLAFGEATPADKANDKFSPERATSLSEQEARACLDYDATLSFKRLEEIKPTVAAIVVQHKHGVELNAINKIDVNTATALATARTSLALNGVPAIGDVAAAALANCKVALRMEGLQALTSAPLAMTLAKRGAVYLPNVRVLDGPIADALCSVPCDVYLPSIAALNPKVASAFSKHQGVLDLDSLTDPPPEVLESVLGNQGPLGLGSVTTLGDPAPQSVLDAIKNHKDSLCLNGIKVLAPAEAKAIRLRTGQIDLWGIQDLPLATAEELVNCNCVIWLMGLEHLDTKVAKTLLKHRPRPGTGFVFPATLRAVLQADEVLAIEQHMGLHFGNDHSP